jgi:hypothetical protein
MTKYTNIQIVLHFLKIWTMVVQILDVFLKDNDPKCKGVNYVYPGVWGAGNPGGCCYKSVGDQLTPAVNKVDFYTFKGSKIKNQKSKNQKCLHNFRFSYHFTVIKKYISIFSN